MHKRGIIRYANYTVCASVFIHFCMQRKNNENIPIIIEVFGCVFLLPLCLLGFSVVVRALLIGPSQSYSYFS